MSKFSLFPLESSKFQTETCFGGKNFEIRKPLSLFLFTEKKSRSMDGISSLFKKSSLLFFVIQEKMSLMNEMSFLMVCAQSKADKSVLKKFFLSIKISIISCFCLLPKVMQVIYKYCIYLYFHSWFRFS